MQWIFELDNFSIFPFELPLMLHVILHQVRQCGELLPSNIVGLSCFLDLNVSDCSIMPVKKEE